MFSLSFSFLFGSLLVPEAVGWVSYRSSIAHGRLAQSGLPTHASYGERAVTHSRRWRDSRAKKRIYIMSIEGEDANGDVVSGRRQRICVLGGGFGGLYTALRLDKLPWRGPKPVVTLIDKRDKFTFLPLLYEFAVGNAELDEVAPTFRELLEGTDVSFVQATLSEIDIARKEVSMVGAVADDLDGYVISDNPDERRTLEYDKLVIALGAEPGAGMERVPGASEHAIPFYSIEDSYRVKMAVRHLKARLRSEVVVRLVVVGGGYGGVEIACNLASELVRGWGGRAEVTLVTNSEVLPMATPGNREAGLRRLRESGIRVLTGTGVGEVRDGGVVVLRPSKDDSSITVEEEIRSDLLIWTAGSRPNSLLASIDVAKDPRGRLEVDRRLRLTRSEASGTFEYDSSASSGSGFPSAEVFCLGDVAAVQGLDLGANAQVALQQANYVAYNIWAQETGQQMLDFRYFDLGEMMSLGGLEASLTALDGRVKLDGKAVGLLRRAIYAVSRKPEAAPILCGLAPIISEISEDFCGDTAQDQDRDTDFQPKSRVRMPTNPQRVRAAASAAAGTAYSITNAVLGRAVGFLDRL